MPTARVADSYGADPNEHKPSQDPWVAEEADEKQAETGGVTVVPDREEESSPGSSSQTSSGATESSSPKTGGGSTRAPNAENPSVPAPKANSSARSTGTGRSAQSEPKGKAGR